jgi:hypothetical protein
LRRNNGERQSEEIEVQREETKRGTEGRDSKRNGRKGTEGKIKRGETEGEK